MNKIITNTLTDTLTYKGTAILKYQIEYPKIEDSNTKQGAYVFNLYNRKKAINLEKYCKEVLYKQAKELYEYNSKNGYPIMVFDIVLKFTITYNYDSLISLYYDQYIYTGGAHGNTIRTSQTWDLNIAKLLPFSYFFNNNPYFILNILNEINKQIAEQIKNNENQYFDNYCELVIETFNPKNFYLFPNYIEVYFQQYDIAPYSSGIPTFKV